jgi:predicted TIM-barrel fold metal-dependent hydrolase
MAGAPKKAAVRNRGFGALRGEEELEVEEAGERVEGIAMTLYETHGSGRGAGDAEDFWAGLGAAEREGLLIILREGGAAELEGWARRHGTMVELFIDGINEKFWELFGDLLVETVDEEPRIQAEYKGDVKKLLGEP